MSEAGSDYSLGGSRGHAQIGAPALRSRLSFCFVCSFAYCLFVFGRVGGGIISGLGQPFEAVTIFLFTWLSWLASGCLLVYRIPEFSQFSRCLEWTIVLVTSESLEPVPVVLLAHCWEAGPVTVLPALDQIAYDNLPLDSHWTVLLACMHWLFALAASGLDHAKGSKRASHMGYLVALANLVLWSVIDELRGNENWRKDW